MKSTRPMQDLFREQFESGRARSQHIHLSHIKLKEKPRIAWDLFPLTEEYYHPLNPCFLFTLQGPHVMKFNRVITVRDGFMTFADFILNNHQRIPEWNNHFIIHPSLAPIVPPKLSSYFSTWSLSQPKKIKLTEAKKINLFAFVCEQYVGSMERVKRKLAPLLDLNPTVEIQLCFPFKKNPFEDTIRDTCYGHRLISEIKDILPHRKLNFIPENEFYEDSDHSEAYFMDLAQDNMIVSDNFLHHIAAGKGSSIESISELSPKKTLFDMDLSFNHKFHVLPFPEVESLFGELLFHKKQSLYHSTVMDPVLRGLLINKLTS